MALTLSINGTTHTVDVEPATPLLWVIRDNIGLSGTKYIAKTVRHRQVRLLHRAHGRAAGKGLPDQGFGRGR